MTASAPRITAAERKEWARARFRGAESSILPSFTPDFAALDEAGIRHDVRQSIAHGFFSVFLSGVSLQTEAERSRFIEIVADEAGDRLLVSTGAGGGPSVEAAVASLRRVERLGCSHVMYSLPSGPDLESEDDVYRRARTAIESTDLGIVLYIQGSYRYPWLKQGKVPVGLLSSLAELPNVVGAKVTQVLDPVSTFECGAALGHKLLLGPVNLELLPMLAKVCPLQYTAMWQVETCQSPEKPYVVEYLNLLAAGRLDDAVALYWQFAPLVKLFWDEQAPLLARGGHPWVHLKYHQWCVGGNGGLFRPADGGSEQFAPVSAADRARIHSTYVQAGIVTREPDDEFLTGRISYAAGVRPADLAPNPMRDWD